MKKLLTFCFCIITFTPILPAQNEQTPTPQWRPVYHFTPQKNWTNDPNGLIYVSGEYHLYNQQNPFENKWGHMSWGHAVSNDLIHWKHLAVAIPETIDKDTTWRFSGSAVRDKNNTSGFCKNSNCLVAVYTADQPNLKKESQYIAYSNDGGMSFTNYKNNPVIDLNKKDFRDPNVFWYEPSKQWLMTVVLPAEHKARFYGSPDLKNWNLLGEFGPQGHTGAVWECPFLIQLPVDGDPAKSKWVLAVSSGGPKGGPFIQYFVGDFDGKNFKNDNSSNTVLTVDYGDTYYAAIPWNNLPNQRKTFIGWMVPGEQKTSPWKGQMSIPRDLFLKNTDEGIRLFQMPSSVIGNELAKISGNRQLIKKNIMVKHEQTIAGEKSGILNKNTNWIEATFTIQSAKTFGLKLAQNKETKSNTLQETIVGYGVEMNELYIDKRNAGGVSGDTTKLVQRVSLKPVNGKIKLLILIDKSSLEVFANDGRKVVTTYIFPDKVSVGTSLFADNGTVKVDSLKIWDLSPVKDSK